MSSKRKEGKGKDICRDRVWKEEEKKPCKRNPRKISIRTFLSHIYTCVCNIYIFICKCCKDVGNIREKSKKNGTMNKVN